MITYWNILCVLSIYVLHVDALENRDVLIRRPIYDASNPQGFDKNFRVCVHAPLSRSPDDEEGDFFYDNGQQQLLGYELWAHHVNYEKKGISIGSEVWGIELVVVEDFSDGDTVAENTDKCIGGEFGHIDWMFAPYTSSLTGVSLQKTENASNILIAAGSNQENVWTPSVEFGFAMYFAEGSAYTYSLPLYAANSAKTIVAFCGFNSASNVTSCTENDFAKLNASAALNGMELVNYTLVDLNSSTYQDDLKLAVGEAQNADIDVVVVNDYSALCVDLIEEMGRALWTPRGLYLVDCVDTPGTREDIGEVYLQHAVTHTSFISDANYTSRVTGYTPASLNQLFKLYSGEDAGAVGVTAFGGGEVMQAAIEIQAGLDPALVRDPVTLSGIIVNGSWNTVMSASNVTFGPSHIADYELSITQFVRDLDFVVVKDSDALVYPMPSWASRECERDTSSCSGHGICLHGSCVCEQNYYGSSDSVSCDAFCVGEIVDGVCRSDRVYYVGVQLDFNSAEFLELASHTRLAMELVNNKTDGWMDDSTMQVSIQWRLNDSACDSDAARGALEHQQAWARNISNGTAELDGVIGAYCSDPSTTIASYGARSAFTQVSPSASLTALNDKEMYPYFARTCSNNEDTSTALIDLFEDLGLNPFIALVLDTDSYARDISNSFVEGWTKRGYDVLGLLVLSPVGENYDNIIAALAALGSPLVLLCMHDPEAEALILAAQDHVIMGSDAVVWAKTAWTAETTSVTQGNHSLYPHGTLSLKPHTAALPAPARYLNLWGQLDPEVYHDANGDRSDISSHAGAVVDAIFSLAQAFQLSINDNTGLDGYELRQYVTTVLQDDVVFEGVSGDIDFNINGDQIYSAYDVLNYHVTDSHAWEMVGTLIRNSSTGRDFTPSLNYSHLMWPDGSSGYTDSYSKQLDPYCPPGYTHELQVGIMSCASCMVGTYKAYHGAEACTACPVGADCNDVGITVPCVLPGFWRDAPPDDSLGDFDAYPIYSCDIYDACLGGCDLTASCAEGRLHLSPTCGVCADDYFQNPIGGCDECTSIQTSTYVAVSYSCGLFVFFFSLIILFSLQIKTEEQLAAPQTSFSRLFQQFRTHYRKAASTQQLLLSFVQILVGVQYYLKVDWPEKFSGMVDSFSLGIFDSISAANSCSDVDSYYFLELLFWFCLAPAVVLLLALVTVGVYLFFLAGTKLGQGKTSKAQNVMNLWNLFCKCSLWTCLVFFPQLSYIMLTAFQCRDFGLTGQYLRVDYDVNCETDTYRSYSILAGCGVIIYSLGIPLLFAVVILYRKHPLLQTPSELLYANYKRNYCYFEIFQIFRKFMLTSVLIWVSEPGQPTMALYLLVVDAFALVVLALLCPYKSDCDNALSMILVSAECSLFLVAFIVLSGVSEVDNYSEHNMYSTLYVIVVASIVIAVPLSFALKFEAVSRRAESTLDLVLAAPRGAWKKAAAKRRFSKVQKKYSTSDAITPSSVELVSNPIITAERK